MVLTMVEFSLSYYEVGEFNSLTSWLGGQLLMVFQSLEPDFPPLGEGLFVGLDSPLPLFPILHGRVATTIDSAPNASKILFHS